MQRWSLDDFEWDKIDRSKIDKDILGLIKAAALTENNAAIYTSYLLNVFRDKPQLCQFISSWGYEEEMHGSLLARYCELADPSFSFAAAFEKFRTGYVIPTEVEQSRRGSRMGELLARCMGEVGTSSFYSALGDSCQEPVLKEVCRIVARDEVRHFATFLDFERDEEEKDRLSAVARMRFLLGRLAETADDELPFAWHCANEPHLPYDRDRAYAAYAHHAYRHYRYRHMRNVVRLTLKAAGISTRGWLTRLLSLGGLGVMKFHSRRMQSNYKVSAITIGAVPENAAI